jgi:hypothetical protein
MRQECPLTEWSVDFNESAALTSLHDDLFRLDTARNKSSGDRIEFLVDRYHGLKIEIFANEHPPPHFRVSCGAGTANYRIDNCEQLNGTLIREYRTIRKWHASHVDELIVVWNRSRPTDFPVGPIRQPLARS